MLMGQLSLWSWIDAIVWSAIDFVEVLNFDLFQLALTRGLGVSLSLIELAAWMFRIFSNSNGIGDRDSIVGLHSSLVEGFLLFLFVTSVWDGFEDHAFSLHHEVVIHWVLFKALGAMHILCCMLVSIFGWSACRFMPTGNAYGGLLEVLFCCLGVPLFATFIVLIWVSDYGHGYLDAGQDWWANVNHIVSSNTARSVLLVSLSWALGLLYLLMDDATPLALDFSMMIMPIGYSIFILDVFQYHIVTIRVVGIFHPDCFAMSHCDFTWQLQTLHILLLDSLFGLLGFCLSGLMHISWRKLIDQFSFNHFINLYWTLCFGYFGFQFILLSLIFLHFLWIWWQSDGFGFLLKGFSLFFWLLLIFLK